MLLKRTLPLIELKFPASKHASKKAYKGGIKSRGQEGGDQSYTRTHTQLACT